MKLTFLGAAGTVTGSKYLLTVGKKRILVDCGLFQGYKQLRLRNWAKLPFAPQGLAAVVLTHAHVDHSGYLPLLVKSGFAVQSIAAKQRAIYAGFSCPTAATCRKKRPNTRTGTNSRSIVRRCRYIRTPMLSARSNIYGRSPTS